MTLPRSSGWTRTSRVLPRRLLSRSTVTSSGWSTMPLTRCSSASSSTCYSAGVSAGAPGAAPAAGEGAGAVLGVRDDARDRVLERLVQHVLLGGRLGGGVGRRRVGLGSGLLPRGGRAGGRLVTTGVADGLLVEGLLVRLR